MIPRFLQRTCIVPILLLMLALPWFGAPGVSAQATPIPAAGPQYTPLLPEVLTPPRWFQGADEQVHLVYEMLLINAFPVPVELTTVEVLNADTGRSVASLTGEPLTTAMTLLTDPNTPTTSLPAGTVGVVWFDVTLSKPEQIPAAIVHRLTVSVPPELPLPPTITMTGGAATVDVRPQSFWDRRWPVRAGSLLAAAVTVPIAEPSRRSMASCI